LLHWIIFFKKALPCKGGGGTFFSATYSKISGVSHFLILHVKWISIWRRREMSHVTYMRRANMSSSASVKVLTFAAGKESHGDVMAKVVAKH
jgi:hypothetical protein